MLSEHIRLGGGSNTEIEFLAGTDEEEEDYVDIDDILGPSSPPDCPKLGEGVLGKPQVVTRSGRQVKFVNKD